MAIHKVRKQHCAGCDEFVDGDLVDMFECSSCGSSATSEELEDPDSRPARCPSCSRFMAVVAKGVCPGCQDETAELSERDAYVAELDGERDTFESRAEAEEWIEEAPERARRRAEQRASLDAYYEERKAWAKAKNELLLPRTQQLLELVPRHVAPELCSQLEWQLRCWEMDIADTGKVTPYLYFPEMVKLLLNKKLAAPLLRVAGDYDLPYGQRQDAEAELRSMLGGRLSPPGRGSDE